MSSYEVIQGRGRPRICGVGAEGWVAKVNLETANCFDLLRRNFGFFDRSMQLITWCLRALLLLYSSQIGIEAADQQVLADIAKKSNQSLLWGPYRPNLYFGVRPRIPKSLTTGLLWAKVDDYQSIQQSMTSYSAEPISHPQCQSRRLTMCLVRFTPCLRTD